jgi:hypothetical protein
MPEHMRMNWEWQLSGSAGALDHPQEPSWRYWSASFGEEHIRTVALQRPQGSQFRSMQRMNTLDPAFAPVCVQSAIPEIDLSPSQGAKLSSPQAMSICQ